MAGLDLMDGFYRGRRVLITGHTGFKGAWMSLALALAGAEVLGYSLDPPSEPSLFGLLRLGQDPLPGHKTLHADILDLPGMCRVVQDFRPQVVVHMAAQSLVRPSYADPAGTFAANVQGTVNLLEACRRAPLEGGRRAIVCVTSDKCYENREWLYGYRENDRLGGHDPYSASKACAEVAAASFAKAFFAPGLAGEHTVLSTARAGNVIGGGDFATDRLVPDMARAFAGGEAVRIRRPGAVRPWQHVLEPVCAYLSLARRMVEDGHAFAGAWNIGPDQADVRSVGEVAQAFARLWGAGARLDVNKGPDAGPHEAGLLTLDCAKARARLGWKPRLLLDEALDWTAAWYRAWADAPAGEAAGILREFTARQITDFLEA